MNIFEGLCRVCGEPVDGTLICDLCDEDIARHHRTRDEVIERFIDNVATDRILTRVHDEQGS